MHLIASDAANYSDCQSIEELHRLHSRLVAFVADANAAFEVTEQSAVAGPRRRRPDSA